jgi:hypothetical protein
MKNSNLKTRERGKWVHGGILKMVASMNTLLARCRHFLKTPWQLTAVAIGLMLSGGVQAQMLAPTSVFPSAGGAGFQLVQRVDDVLFGVDPISLGIIDNRYVSGTFVRVNAFRPSPVIGYTPFVVDCQSPLRIAISESATAVEDKNAAAFLSQRRTADHHLKLTELEFAAPKILDGTRFVSEFACNATRQPGRAAKVARELFEQGGPEDLQRVYCDMQVDGSAEVRRGVEVRYSVAQDVVAVAQQWFSSGFVTEAEVVFGSGGVQWVMDRKTLQSHLINKGGKAPLFTSVCNTRPLR